MRRRRRSRPWSRLRSRPRLAAALSLGALLLGVAVLVVEALIAANREYLSSPSGDSVEATVAPAGGAGADQAPTSAPGTVQCGGARQARHGCAALRRAPLELRMLGDSTAAGTGSPTVAESLPVLVAQRVADRLGRPVHVVGLGVSGARTEDVRTEQVPQLLDAGADVVAIVIGSNDVTHVTPAWRFQEQTEALLRAAREESGAPVVLGGIPRFRTVPALDQPLRALVDAYARPLRSEQRDAVAALGEGYRFVDIAADASPRFLGVPAAMSSDGFHPSPIGYGFWADALAPAIAEAARR